MDELQKPGTDNLPAGNYEEVGPNGERIPSPRSVTIQAGDRLPPTQAKGRKWKKN